MDITAQGKSVPLRIRFPRFPFAVRLTREGFTFIILTLAIGAAAVNTGNNVLYLIFSLMLGLIVVSGVLSKRILLGLIPRVEFPDHLFSGVENVCYVSIRNRKELLPSIGIRFQIATPGFPKVARSFFYVPAGGEGNGFANVFFPQRGVFDVGQMEVQTRFPFSFFVKIRRFDSDQKVRVYPKIYRFPEEALMKFTEGTLLDSPYRGDSQHLLHLREYLPQDSSKRIHWKASARLDKLLIKEFQKEQGQEILIYFDLRPANPDSKQTEIHEKGVSLIASLVFLFLERGASGKVVFPDAEFEFKEGLSSMVPLLDYLSDVKAGGHARVMISSPSVPETVVVQIRSREIAPVFSFQAAGVRPLFIEDWAPLLGESISAEGWKKRGKA